MSLQITGLDIPSSLEAEAAVLNAMILENDYIDSAAMVLTSDMFYSPQNQVIYKNILDWNVEEVCRR